MFSLFLRRIDPQTDRQRQRERERDRSPDHEASCRCLCLLPSHRVPGRSKRQILLFLSHLQMERRHRRVSLNPNPNPKPNPNHLFPFPRALHNYILVYMYPFCFLSNLFFVHGNHFSWHMLLCIGSTKLLFVCTPFASCWIFFFRSWESFLVFMCFLSASLTYALVYRFYVLLFTICSVDGTFKLCFVFHLCSYWCFNIRNFVPFFVFELYWLLHLLTFVFFVDGAFNMKSLTLPSFYLDFCWPILCIQKFSYTTVFYLCSYLMLSLPMRCIWR